MARLAFPVAADGICIDVVIGLSHSDMNALLDAGLPLLTPIKTRGLIDTGTTMTSVATSILWRLGLSPIGQTSTTTLSGTIPVNLYEVSLGVTDFALPAPAPSLTIGELTVMGLPPKFSDFEVLLGRDVILQCCLVVDGPSMQFTLDF